MRSFSSPAYRFHPKSTPGVVALVVLLVTICLQAGASAFRDAGVHHQLASSSLKDQERAGETSMVQSSLRSVQRHGSSTGESCFFQDTNDGAGDNSNHFTVNISECQKRCQESESCTHFIFRPQNRQCFLRTGIRQWVKSVGDLAATRNCKLPANADSIGDECHKINLGSATDNMKVLTVEKNPFEGLKECQGLCISEGGCTHVTYNAYSKKCYLKGGSPSWKLHTGDTSATRNCNLEGDNCLKKNVGSTTNSIKEVEAVTMEACQELCRSTTGCSHFTYNKKTRKCYVKAGEPQWREVWLDFSASVNCDFSKDKDVSVCLKADVGSTTPEIATKSLDAFHREKAYLECLKACHETPSCTHITYNESSKKCYLKSGSPRWRPYGDDVSSTSDCKIPDATCFFDDRLSNAKTIKTLKNMKLGTEFSSVLACREMCRLTSGCTHVTYNISGECELKEGKMEWYSGLFGGNITMKLNCD